MKIKKGDTVKLVKGNDAGKTGEVLDVFPKNNTILIKGIRIAKKHLKASKTSPHGGIIDKTIPVNSANVRIICPNCAKPARVKYTISSKIKSRACNKCNKPI